MSPNERREAYMKILENPISIEELRLIAEAGFGDLVKAVVDIDKDLITIDAELHADLEAYLLEQGSNQSGLWGINLYPDLVGDDFLEFDSMINLRPSQGNTSRGVDDLETQNKIRTVVKKWIAQ